MDTKQALRKAKKLFGKNAAIQERPCYLMPWSSKTKPQPEGWVTPCSAFGAHAKPCPGGLPMFHVGAIEGVAGIRFYVIKETGSNWHDAFARYEEKEARERAEYEARRANSEEEKQKLRKLNERMGEAFFGKRS